MEAILLSDLMTSTEHPWNLAYENLESASKKNALAYFTNTLQKIKKVRFDLTPMCIFFRYWITNLETAHFMEH